MLPLPAAAAAACTHRARHPLPFPVAPAQDFAPRLRIEELARLLCTYCMLEEAAVVKFCFGVYDSDANSSISGPELDRMIGSLHEDGAPRIFEQVRVWVSVRVRVGVCLLGKDGAPHIFEQVRVRVRVRER